MSSLQNTVRQLALDIAKLGAKRASGKMSAEDAARFAVAKTNRAEDRIRVMLLDLIDQGEALDKLREKVKFL